MLPIKIHIRCKTVLLTGQQFIDPLPAIELLTDGLIFIGSISHVILMLIKIKKIEKMKVYNKTVTSGNRSVLGSNKTAVVLEPSQ